MEKNKDQKKIALVTYQHLNTHYDDMMSHYHPLLSSSDYLLIPPLNSKNIQVDIIVWDDENNETPYQEYDALIIRSTWNYHKHVESFERWLSHLEKLKVPLFNSYKTIRWNMNKCYLKILRDHGVRCIPTVWIEKDSKIQLIDVLNEKKWDKVVLKPSFGASSQGIRVVTMDRVEGEQEELEKMLQTVSHVMVQPVMKEIFNGEYSFVFF